MARRRPMSLPRRIGLLLERTTTQKGRAMTKILAGITTSVDGFIAGPDDGPGKGLGVGGADVIRQALETGVVDELTIIIAPVVLGGGKRLFEGFSRSIELEHIGVRQSPFATFIDYRVKDG